MGQVRSGKFGTPAVKRPGEVRESCGTQLRRVRERERERERRDVLAFSGRLNG